MRKLYEINRDIEELLDESINAKLDEETAVNTETGVMFNLTERLEALNVEKNEKIKSVAAYADDISAKLDNLKKKADEIAKTRKTLQNELDGLLDYLLWATNKKGFESDEIVVKVRTTKRTTVFDEEAIPEEFWKTKIERSVMKDEIRKAIKAGRNIPGAMLSDNYKVDII